MADRPWKRVEREKCRELGGDRAGPTGRDTPDCIGLKVGLEIKYIKKYTFLTSYWEQAVENAAKAGLPPVLAVKEAKRGGRDCVQMRWWQLNDLWQLASDDTIDVDGRLVSFEDGPLIRFPWTDFMRLYRAAYTNNEEN